MRKVFSKCNYDISTMSYTQLRQKFSNNPFIESYYNIIGDEKGWSFFHSRRELHFVGKKHFIKTTNIRSITYKNNKFYGNKITSFGYEELNYILDYFKCDWFKNFLKTVQINKHNFLTQTVLKLVISKKVTNEEDLIKKLLKITFKTDKISWRTYRSYICNSNNIYPYINVFNLLDFTVNPEECLKYYNNCKDSNERSLMHDLLSSAADLDEKIDFRWSLKRKISEHSRQINKLLECELSTKENKPIFKEDTFSAHNITLLNTELDVFKEANLMSNCLYSCYWNAIKNKHYLAFKVEGKERCTLGVRINNGKAVFDQVHTIRNGNASEKTENLVKIFVRNLDVSHISGIEKPDYTSIDLPLDFVLA